MISFELFEKIGFRIAVKTIAIYGLVSNWFFGDMYDSRHLVGLSNFNGVLSNYVSGRPDHLETDEFGNQKIVYDLVEAEAEVLQTLNESIENIVAGSTVIMESIVIPPISDVGLGFETIELIAFAEDPEQVDGIATEREEDDWTGEFGGVFGV